MAAVADAVVVLDIDQRVVQWNRGAERLFGWTLTEVIGHPVPMVPDDRKAEYHAVLERVRVSRPISVTTRRIHRNGGLLDVRASFNRLTDVHGTMVGWVCVFHPHTLTPAESELEQLHLAERAHLVRRLGELPPVRVAGTPASAFVLIHLPGAARVRLALRQRGFAVRRGDTFPGLGPDWLRVAVRDTATTDRFVAALADILEV